MKLRYLILGIVIGLLILGGCTKKTVEENIVEILPENESGNVSAEGAEGPEEISAEDRSLSTKDLIKKLSEEAGLPVEEEEGETAVEAETNEVAEETVEENTGSQTEEVIIDNFIAEPEDLSVKVGDTIKWTNNMENFKQIIVIFPQEDGSYSTKEINDKVEIFLNESYEFTFNETGSYKWGSLTKFDKIYGIITVS